MPNRRRFVSLAGSCLGHLAAAAPFLPAATRRLWAAPHPSVRLTAQEKFGRLEQVTDGVWALISTPLGGDYTTVSNGGIVAGRSGVLVFEGLQTPAGAEWLAAQARTLTGRWPTHVAISHYHGDHANGLAGYRIGGTPRVHVTSTTRDQVLERNRPANAERAAALADALVIRADAPSTIDLGGRVAHLVPRHGHTASDVTLELDDPSIVFGGDLVWNAMFPNYVDASPRALASSVQALRRNRETQYVPGHGPLAKDGDLTRYIAMLGEVESAARHAIASGTPVQDAARAFRLPESLGEWTLFSPAFYERAFVAWQRDLAGPR